MNKENGTKIFDKFVKIATPVILGTVVCVAGQVIAEGKIKNTKKEIYYIPADRSIFPPDDVPHSSSGIVRTIDGENAVMATSIASPIRSTVSLASLRKTIEEETRLF